MLIKDIKFSGLYISEDEYDFKGTFIMANDEIIKNIDITELDNTAYILEVKDLFALEECTDDIVKVLKTYVHEHSAISSKINEGEFYSEKSTSPTNENKSDSLSMS